MFELKYSLTDGDVKSAGKAVNLKYVIMYLCVALVGLAVGITAIIVNSQTFMFVIGIIITVFGGLLLVLSVLLAVAPKTALESVVKTFDIELTVMISHENITVICGDDDKTEFSYSDITSVKKLKNVILAFFGKTEALIIKPDGNIKELYEYIEKRQGRKLPIENT